jgi:DnaK suppressor protein
MDDNTLAGFRQLLDTRLKMVVNESFLKPPRPGLPDPMNSAETASLHRDGELVVNICYRNQNLVREIRSAIKRIDDGEFGTCSICSSPISIERLRAYPIATMCIRCQGAIEMLRRRLPA